MLPTCVRFISSALEPVLLRGGAGVAAEDLGEVALVVEAAVQGDLVDVQAGLVHQGAGLLHPEIVQQVCEGVAGPVVEDLGEITGLRCAAGADSVYGLLLLST